ncbi:hypothetical protein GCM10018790_27030 [Kitasatospora xanthocidica]|nr:hypothetical protein GCM10018790_27030 [Kitasatospora xanthocidica]
MHNQWLRREMTPRELEQYPVGVRARRLPGGVSDSVSESELDSSVAFGYTVPLRCLLAAP